MNPCTTGHPLATKSLWDDFRKHPRLSFVFDTLVLALVVAPLVLGCLYKWAISDIGAEANPFPGLAWLWGSLIAFVFGLCVSAPV